MSRLTYKRIALTINGCNTILSFVFLFTWNILGAQSFADSMMEETIRKHRYTEAEKKISHLIAAQLSSMSPVQRTYYYTLASDIKFKKGDYQAALEMSKKAISETASIEDSIIYYRAFLAHIAVLQTQGKFDALHDYLDPAYQFASKVNNAALLRLCYVQLGALALHNNRYNESMEWYKKALDLSKRNTFTEYIHYDELSVGFLHCTLNQLDSAQPALQRAIQLAIADNDSTVLATSYNVLAYYSLLLDDRKTWKENVQKSLAIGRKLKHKALITAGYSQLMETALKESKFTEAIQLGNQAFATLSETNIPMFEIQVDSLMYEAHKGLGNTDLALSYFEKYYKGKYAILTREQAEKLDVLKASYDMKEKNMVIAKQQLELNYSKKQSWFLLLFNLLLGFLLTGGWLYRKMKQSYQGKLYKKEKWTEYLLDQKEKLVSSYNPADIQKTHVAIPENEQLSSASEEVEIISEDKKELYLNMIKAIENQKLYLNPNLDVNLIVTTLGTNKFYLYQAISKNASENFRNIINRYRVEEAKRLIEKGAREKSLQNIEAIHTEAGFNSPSSYYRIFRNMTGLTPKEYMQEYVKDIAGNHQQK